jgi:acetyltransferase-like isoleucine patch superfamily enzyme
MIQSNTDDQEVQRAPQGIRTQATIVDPRENPLSKYQRLMTGSGGIWYLIKYEIIMTLLMGFPGLLGLTLRYSLYRFLFKNMGKSVAIGRNVILRHPHKIQLGNNVVIDDEVVLDAKGDEGTGIIIHDGVFIGRGTIINARSGYVEIGEGSSISSYCRISRSNIGRNVLIAAYVYIIGGGHQSTRVDVPIMKQPIESKGGVKLGDGCWIGAVTTLLDGLRVGNDAIIGAHSLVTRDVPSFAIAFGVPAEVKSDRRDRKDNGQM